MVGDGDISKDVLQQRERPDFEEGDNPLRLVDLFSGCGGLTLGIAQAARHHRVALDVRLAVDLDEAALNVYGANFPKAVTRLGRVEDLLDGALGADLTLAEAQLVNHVGPVDMLVAGPPCQGHSDLNNHTRRADPKNGLYLRVARAAAVLRPAVVLIENVPTAVHDKSGVVGSAIKALEKAGYQVADNVVQLERLGVAQRRRRHVVLAALPSIGSPTAVLQRLLAASSEVDLHWAIGDLVGAEPTRDLDRPSRVSPENAKRMQWLIDNDEYDLPNELRPHCHQGAHSYKSMYGRLRWSQPAQTLTSGFGSMGQGRYMHPVEPRALTPHEAARIQGFPDYFDFGVVSRRSDLATMIGNAVPPALSRAIAEMLIPDLCRVVADEVAPGQVSASRDSGSRTEQQVVAA